MMFICEGDGAYVNSGGRLFIIKKCFNKSVVVHYYNNMMISKNVSHGISENFQKASEEKREDRVMITIFASTVVACR